MDVLYRLSYIGRWSGDWGREDTKNLYINAFKPLRRACALMATRLWHPAHSPVISSGRRGSNSLPSAWKADALPNELLPLKPAKPGTALQRTVGRTGFEPVKTDVNRF